MGAQRIVLSAIVILAVGVGGYLYLDGLRPAGPAVPRLPPTWSVHAENPVIVDLTTVLPDDPGKASETEGASFLGFPFVPSKQGAVLHVHVTANAWSAEENELVVAVFIDGAVPPAKMARKSIAPNARATIDLSFDVSAKTATRQSFDFRVGSALGKPFTFNGPHGGAPGGGRLVASATVTEQKPSAGQN